MHQREPFLPLTRAHDWVPTRWHILTALAIAATVRRGSNRSETHMPTSMNISLPETMKSFVDQQVESGGYGSVSEYIRELIRKTRDNMSRQVQLELLLLEG